MITINGKQVSEETAALALEEYFKNHPKPYIFEKGDVCVNNGGSIRIIVSYHGKLKSSDTNGNLICEGQKRFEVYGYRKIGELGELNKLLLKPEEGE